MLQYHPLITWSKASLDFLGFLAQGFQSWFCKLNLFDTVISGQSFLALPSEGNQTRPIAPIKLKEKFRRQVFRTDQKGHERDTERSHSYSTPAYSKQQLIFSSNSKLPTFYFLKLQHVGCCNSPFTDHSEEREEEIIRRRD